MAVVGLIGEDRLWFKSITGLEGTGGEQEGGQYWCRQPAHCSPLQP